MGSIELPCKFLDLIQKGVPVELTSEQQYLYIALLILHSSFPVGGSSQFKPKRVEVEFTCEQQYLYFALIVLQRGPV